MSDVPFFDGVIVRRAQERDLLALAIATGETVDVKVGSPLTKAERRALAAQRRAAGLTNGRAGGAWTKGVKAEAVARVQGTSTIDPAVLAASKTARTQARKGWADLQKVAKAQATFAL